MSDFKLIDLVKGAIQARSPSVWPTFDGKMLDRSKYMTSSEAGNCERMIWFDKNTEEKPATTHEWGFFERGHSVERWVTDQLKASNDNSVKYTMMGEDQRSFHSGYQSGTPDGLASTSEGVTVLEFKSIDPRTNIKNLPKPNHIAQCIQNMDLVMECMPELNILGAKLLYINASDFTKMYEFEVEYDIEAAMVLEKKAEKIMEAGLADELEPWGIFNNGCTYCKHTSKCSAVVEQKQIEASAYAALGEVAKGVFK